MKNKHRSGYRKCPICMTTLKKNGHTSSNKQRWYCKKCQKSVDPNNKLFVLIKRKKWLLFFIEYLLHTKPLIDYGISNSTFFRMTKEFRNINLNPLCDYLTYSKVIYLDAIYFDKECCMIARNNKVVIGWRFCEKESFYDWYEFIRQYPAPEYVVCDGGVGLMSAIKEAWPKAKHQRCLFHVWMNIRAKLTLHPETEAGIKLLNLGRELLHIDNLEQKDSWLIKWKDWFAAYKEMVSEKSINNTTGEIWWTHEKLRSAAWNLGKLILNNNLFYYLIDKDVSKTNNYLEGGINSQLKHLLYFHRGCSHKTKKKLIEFYLLKRSNFFDKVIQMLYIKKK